VTRRVLPVALVLAAALAEARWSGAPASLFVAAAVLAGAVALLLLACDLVDEGSRALRAELVLATAGLGFVLCAGVVRAHDLDAATLTALGASVAAYSLQAVVAALWAPVPVEPLAAEVG
jgi:hypothetical protein